jgi:hypothetical protein
LLALPSSICLPSSSIASLTPTMSNALSIPLLPSYLKLLTCNAFRDQPPPSFAFPSHKPPSSLLLILCLMPLATSLYLYFSQSCFNRLSASFLLHCV